MKLCCDYNAMNRSTYIIAEACSNHMGDLDRAKVLIRGAAEAQANAIKFQAIKREKLHIDPKSLDPRIEIPDFWWAELKKEAIDYGIDLIVTPLYLEAVDLLANRGIFEMKIASGDLIWDDLLERVKEKARIVYLSTGMSNLSEIEKALSCLGWRDHKKEINSHHFPLFIFLFHCVGAYPVPFRDMNLRAIQTMKKAFKLPVGLSDHSLGWVSCLGAISLGARLIEKHITVVQGDEAPESGWSLGIKEFKQMVRDIHNLENALSGDGIKECQSSEKDALIQGRRGWWFIPGGIDIFVRPANR